MCKKSVLTVIVVSSLFVVTVPLQATLYLPVNPNPIELPVNPIETVTVTAATLQDTTFGYYNAPPTGTGVFNPFVRIQNDGAEKGYNTDGELEFDQKQGQTGGKNWTHSLKLGDIPVINGSIEFLLDINQSQGGDNRYLSLDAMQIFLLADSGSLGDYDPVERTLANAAPIYDLFGENVEDNWVKMDSSVFHPGSGTGDVRVTIPINPDWSPDKYLYLYSEFGQHNSSNGGFEEWAVAVPEPATIALLGLGALSLLRKRSGK
jgi:hypothetical protein